MSSKAVRGTFREFVLIQEFRRIWSVQYHELEVSSYSKAIVAVYVIIGSINEYGQPA